MVSQCKDFFTVIQQDSDMFPTVPVVLSCSQSMNQGVLQHEPYFMNR